MSEYSLLLVVATLAVFLFGYLGEKAIFTSLGDNPILKFMEGEVALRESPQF
jgi:hypothetical protein